MANNFTNINKKNNHLAPQTTEHKKDNDIWHWKSRYWLGRDTKKCGRLNRLIGSPTFDNWNSNDMYYIKCIKE
jgi:hypothetical protein